LPDLRGEGREISSARGMTPKKQPKDEQDRIKRKGDRIPFLWRGRKTVGA